MLQDDESLLSSTVELGKPLMRTVLLNPGPATTTNTVKLAQVQTDICPREKEFGDLVAWIQEKLVEFVGDASKYSSVLIGGSGTAAMEMVLSSVVPNNGGVLIINNGAYGQRMMKIANIHTLNQIEFQSSNYAPIDYDALNECILQGKQTLKNDDKSLTHLVVIHHETTSGLLNDITKLGELCKSHNLSFIVDGMSSYAALPIDMEKDNIDYLITSSNKNLQGMAGVGIAICNNEALEKSKEIEMRSLYLNLYDQYSYFKKTKQFRFTPPVQTLYALEQAVKETIEETLEGRYNRYMKSYRVLRDGMEHLGFKVLVPEEYSSGIITTFFDPKDENYDFDQMHNFLFAKGFTIYPGKVSQASTFRIANIGDINEKDITRFLDCLQLYLSHNNITSI